MPSPTPPRTETILFVHGIWDTGRVWGRFARRAEEAGFRTLCPSFTASSGKEPLAGFVDQVRAMILQERPKHLIGFSLGGVVSRAALGDPEVADSLATFLTISAPHRGSWGAFFFRQGRGYRQLRPGSDFLKALPEPPDSLSVESYWTALDLMILPSYYTYWKGQRNRHFWKVLHPWMLTDRRVQAAALRHLAKGGRS
ncbi:MAG: alpha/beta fold hydrolase [Verrucomicrobiota bacterium]